MSEINVGCEKLDGGWVCRVDVRDGPSVTRHSVGVSVDDLARLAPGWDAPDDLVRRSFEFLLAREPKESILREFDLPVIARYFPEYEAAIRPE